MLFISGNNIDCSRLTQSHWDLEELEVHKEGIDGEGITVAVLDSAINILHVYDDIKN